MEPLTTGFIVTLAFTKAFEKTIEKFTEAALAKIESVKFAIPHLEEVAENLTNALNDEDLIWPFIGLGRFYAGQGSYSLAEPWYRQCLSVVKTRLGDDHPDVATSLNNLASLYDSQGRYSEAEPLYLQALEIAERVLGVNHPNTVTIRENLAILQAKMEEA